MLQDDNVLIMVNMLFVNEHHRKRGIGTALLKHVGHLARSRGGRETLYGQQTRACRDGFHDSKGKVCRSIRECEFTGIPQMFVLPGTSSLWRCSQSCR